MFNRAHAVLAVLSLPLLLAACGGATSTVNPGPPAAQSVTLNGVRVIDASTYQLGVSALDGSQGIVRSGTLSQPRLSDLSAGQATAEVCGQIQVQDVLTTAITLDSTGSMQDTDPMKVRQQAAQTFVGRMSAADRAAVLSFDTGTAPSAGLRVAHLWQDFTGDQALLKTGIGKATFAGGNTPLYTAISDADTLLGGTTGSNMSVLVLTDGEDNDSSLTPDEVIVALKKSGTKVFAVGLDTTGTLNFAELERIASESGGLFQKADSAALLKDYFDRVYNAVSAQGCLQLKFTTRPAPRTTVTGRVAFIVSSPGKTDVTLTTPFQFTSR